MFAKTNASSARSSKVSSTAGHNHLGMEPAVQLGRCGRTNKEDAMRTYLIGAGLLLSLTAPALAEEFYIVQNPTTKKCTIVTERPTTTTTTVVGGTTYTVIAQAALIGWLTR